MTPERRQRIKDIAFEALDLESDERARFLDRECGSDREFRREVEEFLDEDQDTGDTIERAIAGAAVEAYEEANPEGAGLDLESAPASGFVISHYRVVEKLGEGGMGVVYKAIDTKLDRPVALKFLGPSLLEDPEANKRFQREAKAAAALDHPNICTIYEIDEADGRTFLAMAFIEGRTVRDMVAERPLPIEEALDIAVQTAQGLQAAHQKEVVHRDIKSANLMVTPAGQVKIMDFGLAQLAEASKLTKTAAMLGTPVYMSPEQARRRPTDRRTDVWSLAVVLYEMVTGRLPFEGEKEQAVLYGIMNEEPEPPTALRSRLPLELDRIVARAMVKNPDERYQHIDEMLVDLRGLKKGVARGAAAPVATGTLAGPRSDPEPAAGLAESLSSLGAGTGTSAGRHWLPVALAVALMLLAVTVGVIAWQNFGGAEPSAGPLRKFQIDPGVAIEQAVISPNGKHIAYISGSTQSPATRLMRFVSAPKLMIHDLAKGTPREVASPAETGWPATYPFWSPDSEFVGFRSGSELKEVSVRSGVPTTICNLPRAAGAAWSPDGNFIVLSAGYPPRLLRVPSSGGSPEPLAGLDDPEGQDQGHWFPSFVPFGRERTMLLFGEGDMSRREIVMFDLESGQKRALAKGAFPVYSPTGHVLYQSAPRDGTLWALPFSSESIEPTGEAFAIAPGGRIPSVSTDGTLVHVSSGPVPDQLVLLDRKGEKVRTIGRPQMAMNNPELSPDGSLAGLRAWDSETENADIWAHGVFTDTKTRVTFDTGDEGSFAWSPSGKAIAYMKRPAGVWQLFVKSLGGSEPPRPLLASNRNEYISDWSTNGKHILYYHYVDETGVDIWYLERNERDGEYQAVPFLREPFNQYFPKLSPDGRVIAYSSNDSGRYEVYVRPFPGGDDRRQISTNGGGGPRWSRDGKELFYVEGDALIAVPVTTRPGFSFGSPRQLFRKRYLRDSLPVQKFDVTPDGKHFVVVEPVEDGPPQKIHLVENWFEEFRGDE